MRSAGYSGSVILLDEVTGPPDRAIILFRHAALVEGTITHPNLWVVELEPFGLPTRILTRPGTAREALLAAVAGLLDECGEFRVTALLRFLNPAWNRRRHLALRQTLRFRLIERVAITTMSDAELARIVKFIASNGRPGRKNKARQAVSPGRSRTHGETAGEQSRGARSDARGRGEASAFRDGEASAGT